MQSAIDAASLKLGRPPLLSELEGPLPDGLPVLPGGLLDNPLQPGVGGVQAACPAVSRPDSDQDWVYCEATGRIDAAWSSLNR